MAFIQCDFFSEVLQLGTSMNVVLPEAGESKPYPVLYLLHGMSEDHTAWMRRTSIERYAAKYGMAVVMPGGHRSYYADMAYGMKFWTFIKDELLAKTESFFPVSGEPSCRYVAGISMGGYGALKLAFNCPDRFAAAASLSGAVDVLRLPEVIGEERREESKIIFGSEDALTGSMNDLHAASRKVAESGASLPRLYQCCGTEDFLIEHNRDFRDHLTDLGVEFTYEEGPGAHDWEYWDPQIQRVLRWLRSYS